jgi:hypothetical protein
MIYMGKITHVVEEETTVVIALLSSMPMTWICLVSLVSHVLEFPIGIKFIPI